MHFQVRLRYISISRFSKSRCRRSFCQIVFFTCSFTVFFFFFSLTGSLRDIPDDVSAFLVLLLTVGELYKKTGKMNSKMEFTLMITMTLMMMMMISMMMIMMVMVMVMVIMMMIMMGLIIVIMIMIMTLIMMKTMIILTMMMIMLTMMTTMTAIIILTIKMHFCCRFYITQRLFRLSLHKWSSKTEPARLLKCCVDPCV